MRIGFLKVTLFGLALGFALFGLNQGVFSDKSFDQLLQEAKESDKPIMLVLSTQNCPPCKKMEKTTFRNKELQEIVKSQFLATKMMNNNLDAITYVLEHNIRAYPQILFLEPNGQVFHRMEGFFDAPSMIQVIRDLKVPEKKN